ncbi:Aste57867_13021 [Aphanomyces stellatus]|uniref:Aste57867_13021 protein n=1 Tax=Aphanomyces stellatus TaxID=120398 RepID=A0A485KYQ3_9STRA|nr:hypothetical protein As57867_012973 [Aphanomyces stellatus]VFT89866.1 Aste57867_13021 [Aphanomyces stellatus]
MSAAVGEVSAAIGNLGTITTAIKDKVALFGSSLDTRANHEQVTELTKDGNDLVQNITAKLQKLVNSALGADKSAARKLTKDFKAQMSIFEQVCQKAVASESTAVQAIRSTSERIDPSKERDLTNYNEDQIYAQAHVNVYNEDDLVRREEDIIQINHKLGEINAAYKEIDGLVQDQQDVVSRTLDRVSGTLSWGSLDVVEIEENTAAAHEDAARALENVQQADKKTGYATCTCCYLCTIL